MSQLSGTLGAFGIAPLAGIPTQLVFTANHGGFKGSKVLTNKPVRVYATETGAWSTPLESTDAIVPAGCYYTLAIDQGMAHFEVIGLRIYVPEGTWTMDTLPGMPLSAETVLVSLSPPPAGYVGWYLNAPGAGNPVGNPNDPLSSGTGILEIVS